MKKNEPLSRGKKVILNGKNLSARKQMTQIPSYTTALCVVRPSLTPQPLSLSASSGGHRAASSSGYVQGVLHQNSGDADGIVRCPNSQESCVYNAVSCIKAFYLHSVLVNHW